MESCDLHTNDFPIVEAEFATLKGASSCRYLPCTRQDLERDKIRVFMKYRDPYVYVWRFAPYPITIN